MTVETADGVEVYELHGDMDPPVDSRTGEVIDDAYFARLRHRREQAEIAAMVRGRRLWDWIPVIDEHKRANELESARDLTMECLDAMEAVSAAEGWLNGAAGWYNRAGIIFRKLGDYDGEVAVIDRGLSFMPKNEELLKRRVRAVAMRDRSRGTP